MALTRSFVGATLSLSLLGSAWAGPIQDTILSGLKLDMPQEAALSYVESKRPKRPKPKEGEIDWSQYMPPTCKVVGIDDHPLPGTYSMEAERCIYLDFGAKRVLKHKNESTTLYFTEGKLGEVSIRLEFKEDPKTGGYHKTGNQMKRELYNGLRKEFGKPAKESTRDYLWELPDRRVELHVSFPGDLQFPGLGPTATITIQSRRHVENYFWTRQEEDKRSFWQKLFD